MILAFLIITIIILFLLRVPMAFAILGPSVVYFIIEGNTPHLAIRLAGDRQLATSRSATLHPRRHRGHENRDRRPAI